VINPFFRLLLEEAIMDEPHRSLTVDRTWYTEAVHLRLPDAGTGYVISIPVRGAFGAVHRGHAVDADPARAAVFQPDGDVDLRCGVNCGCYLVWIDMSVLADVLEHHLGHAVHRPLNLASTLNLDTAAGRTWTALIRLLDLVPVMRHPLLADQVQETVVARLLLAVDHPYREELDAPTHSWGPGPVRRMVDAVEAFPRYPFTVTELADLSGVSVRFLRESCLRHLEVSPVQQLRSVRLARAHHELADTEAGQATVGEIASGWGFATRARFTADYADRYGVPPWQTLRGPAYA
jgi:AraC-like DNA-binding protein